MRPVECPNITEWICKKKGQTNPNQKERKHNQNHRKGKQTNKQTNNNRQEKDPVKTNG